MMSTVQAAVIFTCILLVTAALLPASECLGPVVKVCGARELKEVTEVVCSTLGKRDAHTFPSILRRRIKSKLLPMLIMNC